MTGMMNKPRILIVDDVPGNLKLLVEILGDGYKLSVATDGAQALQSAIQRPPDLILLDVMMPEMDGYEVLRRLRAHESTREVAVIFVTALNEARDVVRGLEMGAVDYIARPIEPSVARARVQTHLTLKQQKDALRAVSLAQEQTLAALQEYRLQLENRVQERTIELQRSERAQQSRIAISALLETGMEPLSMSKQLDAALDIIVSVPWLSLQYKGSIFLMDPATEELVLAAHRNLSPVLVKKCARIAMGHCLCGRAARLRQIVHASEIDHRHDIRYDGMQPHGHYCLPILSRDQLVGVINLYLSAGYVHLPEEEAFLVTIAQTVGSLIELRLAEQRLQEEQAFISTVLKTAPALVMVWDHAGRIMLFNQACQNLTGHDEAEACGRLFWELLWREEERQEMPRVWEQLYRESLPNHHESRWLNKNGGFAWVAWSANAILQPDGVPRHVIVTGVDITERRRAEELLRHTAGHDPLTGIPNRRLFQEHLGKAIAYSQRNQSRLAVLYLDLDGFKLVNDRLGHQAGDRLLTQVVGRIQAVIRRSDTLARLGGDEFVIIQYEAASSANAEQLAHKILQVIADPFLLQGEVCRLGVSIGITLYPDHGEDEETLLKHADQAMYAVKKGGRNHHLLYSKALVPAGE